MRLDWSRLSRGNSAEQLACSFLQQQGYSLVTRNYRTRQGEIDLIVENETMLLIVEVRYRSNPDYGLAAESIDARKQARIIRCAEQYLAQNPPSKQVRLDVITVTPADPVPTIHWIEDAFRA
ncbi:MAG: YraN family protein [Methylococcales bacterium]